MLTVKTLSCVLVFAMLLMVGGLTSCAGGQKTTVTTTTVTTPIRADTLSAHPVNSQEATGPRQETTVTTTTRETEEEPSPGIIGSAFGLVGAVIAFPFRVVGGVLDGLF